jgi:uncharacterized membrane protein
MSGASSSPTARLQALDRLKGAVMVLMALDHVRVFAGVPAGGATAGVFFTRWVTHFCAPVFVFLAGTSIFLSVRRHAGVSRHLLVRGAWIVLAELTIVRLAWTFNGDVTQLMAGVLWCIGGCLLVMALLVRLPLPAVAGLGLAFVAGHDALDLRGIARGLGDGPLDALVKIVYVGPWAGPIALGEGAQLQVLYSLVPWVGVMALGFVFGRVVTLAPGRRDRLCLAIGLAAMALFLVLRATGGYGDMNPWRAQVESGRMPPLLAFLNTSKYPASLQFLLMTLGPAIALLPALQRLRGRVSDWLEVLGRVPFFYYLLHVPLIHALALVVSLVRLGHVDPWLFLNHPMGVPPAPDGSVWPLAWLYGTWIVAVALLTPACRWFARLRTRPGASPWLRYL